MRVAAADDSQLGRSTRHSLMGEERWIDRRARSGDFLSLFIFWGFFLLLITNATHSSSTHLSLSLSLAWLLVLLRMFSSYSSSSSTPQQLLHYIGNSRKQEGEIYVTEFSIDSNSRGWWSS